MIGLTVKVFAQFDKVLKEADKATVFALRRSAFGVFERSRESIEAVEGPSDPGKPPHTHTQGVVKSKRSRRQGQKRLGVLPRSIKYTVDAKEMTAFIGPTAFDAGQSGNIHEFGGEYKGGTFPARPFMRPALDATQAHFIDDFAGSIGE